MNFLNVLSEKFRSLFPCLFKEPTPYIPQVGDIVSIPGEPIGIITHEVMEILEDGKKLSVRRAYYRGYPENEGTRMPLYTKNVKLHKRIK